MSLARWSVVPVREAIDEHAIGFGERANEISDRDHEGGDEEDNECGTRSGHASHRPSAHT